MIRPMRVFEESDVRAIRRACQPGWPEFPEGWHQTFMTFVVEHERRIVGWTAFGIGPLPVCPHIPTQGLVVYGQGVFVAPDARGRGYGRDLHEARINAGKAVGATTFVGMTAPSNAPMLRLFEHFGYRHQTTAPDAYPDGSDGLVYVGGIA